MAAATAYVGNLSWDTTKETLADHFDAEFAVASAVVQRHADSQRSKGWGLVTFEKEADLELAIRNFQRVILMGARSLSAKTVVLRLPRANPEYASQGGSSAMTPRPLRKRMKLSPPPPSSLLAT